MTLLKRSKFISLTTAVYCFFSAPFALANNPIIDEYKSYLPDGANLTLLVQGINQKEPIYAYNELQQSLPASTLKVITALAALLELGEHFTFTTQFEIDKEENIENGEVQNLTLRFTGDPSFTRQDLKKMIDSLKGAGINRIKGNLIIDVSAFSGHDKAPGWSWNDLTQCFNAPPSPAIIDRNCFSFSLSAKKSGEIAEINIADFYPVNVISTVNVLDENDTNLKHCELDVRPGDLNLFLLTGCMRKRKDPIALGFSVQDGAHYAGQLTSIYLANAGITVDGSIVRQTLIKPIGQVMVQHNSEPLRVLLKTMLKKSDNLIADTLFRTIGQHRYSTSGTWSNSEKAIREILSEQANIDLGNNVIVDGSGLSRYNLITPQIMMQVLQFIGVNDNQLNFIEMLPEAGKDGTLAYRGGLDAAGVNGKVNAKTGALRGVYNLAGFITGSSGKKIAFVQFITGYSVSPEDYKNRRAPLVKFESRLYKDIYQKN
ncbi:serine-type D-Ala-D-Ala carboxypeptidase [Thorsellia kenyensis]|uniref:Serine-type D-Ala-D-Ala carboxypeptidase n=1 Tax=Thorsellia kenyensis TaxID=1549888 RepID=A0ABV6C959_9GAMM